jgi:phospholipase C
VKIVTTLEAYEADGKPYEIGEERAYVKIHSHHIRDEWVVIETFDGASYTVKASELHRAVSNAEWWKHK